MTTVVEFPDRRLVAEEAAQWLVRLDADRPPSRKELQALGEWLRRSPAHREELASLATLWGRMNVLTELAVPLGNSRRPTPGRRRASSRQRLGLLAAAIVVAFAVGLALLARRPTDDPLLAGNGVYTTAVGQQTTTILADGSQVILNTNSQIKVDYGASYRQVHLVKGEALFTVAKNAERPFRVYASNRRIEALGTAFSVYLKGADVSVTVTEGRVALAALDPSRSKAGQSPHDPEEDVLQSLGMLEAGHVATLHDSSAQAVAGIAGALEAIEPVAPEELAQRLAWREGVLMFSGETLEEAVAELSRYTTLAIEIPDASVRHMRIGGRFPIGETEAMLGALEANFNLRVTRLGHDRVVLSAAEK
jgi:transmembrane sensor